MDIACGQYPAPYPPSPYLPGTPGTPGTDRCGQSAAFECWFALQQRGIQRGNDRQPFRGQEPNLVGPDGLATATVGEHALASQKQPCGLHEGTTAPSSLDSLSRPTSMLPSIGVAGRCATTGFLIDWLGHDGSLRLGTYDVYTTVGSNHTYHFAPTSYHRGQTLPFTKLTNSLMLPSSFLALEGTPLHSALNTNGLMCLLRKEWPTRHARSRFACHRSLSAPARAQS